MKTKNKLKLTALALLALFSTLNPQLSTLHAQGTAFTYQGRLNDGGSPANGSYDLKFSLFSLTSGGIPLASPVTNLATTVSNGLFTTTIDFGAGVFTGASNWLEIAVSTNGANSFSTLAPRQPVTPTPYAVFAEGANAAGINGTIPDASLVGTYDNAVNFNNAANRFDGLFSGSGAGLTGVWHTTGDFGTMPGINFLGTVDNQPLELHVNRNRALRLEPLVNDANHSNIVNLLGGSPANQVWSGVYGATITGGGGGYYFGYLSANTVEADFGTVSGGFGNTASGKNATVGGGSGNASSGLDATIGGGYQNFSSGGAATIAGGYQNFSSSNSTTVAGGAYNTASGQEAAVGGGQNNLAGGAWSVVGGGIANTANGDSSFVGGGEQNAALAQYSTVAGGLLNTNFGSTAFIGGGNENLVVQTNGACFIGAGEGNTIQAGAADSAIVSGNGNTIAANTELAVVVGGLANANSGQLSFIGGGVLNSIVALYATVVGGRFNSIQTNAYHSFIGGGVTNVIQAASEESFIGGGDNNLIQSNTWFAVIGGGVQNTIQTNAGSSFIGGGAHNVVGNIGATVPGGFNNSAMGLASFAAGTQAQATNDGSFVLADNQSTNFYSTTSNQLSARFTGGVRFITGGAGMTLDGQPVGAGNGFWSTKGNAGTTPGANFIGTTDGQPLLLRGSFVGVGRSNPITTAEYFGVETPATAGNYGGMYVDTASAGALPFYGYSQAGVATAYHYVDGNDTNKWKLSVGIGVRLTVTQNGNVGMGTTTPANPLQMGSGAYCSAAGVWTSVSDRNLKEDFTAIEPGEVLAKVAALPITQWKYKVEPSGTKHIGPVAQDFHSAFGLGDSDKAIGSVDEGGVALAAIQGLNEKLEARSKKLEMENEALKQRLEALEKIILNQQPN